MPIENVGNVRLLSIIADSTLDCEVPSGGAGMKVNPSVSVLHYTSADYRRKPPELWRWVSGGVTCNGDITLFVVNVPTISSALLLGWEQDRGVKEISWNFPQYSEKAQGEFC